MKADIREVISIAKKAGKEILKIYKTDFNVEYKESKSFDDGISPLSEADKSSNEIIEKELKKKYPKIPILSEEGKEIPYAIRRNWDYFWLVDPLDGTKEFISRSGDFTVNIALIHQKKPVMGVVLAPALATIYYSEENCSYMQVNDEMPTKLPVIKSKNEYVIVASRSHRNKETEDYIEKIKQERIGNIELQFFGSSLKLCKVAEGKADLYPRLGPTMEWDIAAAHAVVNGAGKRVYIYNSLKEVEYNKENLVNEGFIVR